MAFENIAKSLLKQTGVIPVPANHNKSINERATNLIALAKVGFDPEGVCQELRSLYDECSDEEKGIKRQILDMIVKMNGMMVPEVAAGNGAPIINLQINGDNARINAMLCPPSNLVSTT